MQRWLTLVVLLSACTRTEPAAPASDPNPPEATVVEPTPEPPVPDLFANALLAHKREPYFADLDEIRKRGVLRVAMLNNAASYFIYRGQEVGFQYELAALLAARLSVRLEVVVPNEPAELLNLLVQGRADVVPISPADNTPPAGISLSAPFLQAHHVLVQRLGDVAITVPEQLIGRRIVVRRSSSYWPALQALVDGGLAVTLVPADETLETEELIAQVAANEIDLTVSNSVLLDIERAYRNDVVGSYVFAKNRPLVYAVREGSPQLFARVQRFAQDEPKREAYKTLHARYLEGPARVDIQAQSAAVSGAISPYDDLVRRLARDSDFDWRLVLAQMYQESRFNPLAKSFAGARGLMQLMPRTARELGVTDVEDPEQNVRGGVAYLQWLMGRFDKSMPLRQRVRFVLASYNAGYEHVQDARQIAQRLKLDPNRWFGHVEKAMLLLEKPAYYRKARRGYCRGSEPVAYVSRIQTKFEAYSMVSPQ